MDATAGDARIASQREIVRQDVLQQPGFAICQRVQPFLQSNVHTFTTRTDIAHYLLPRLMSV